MFLRFNEHKSLFIRYHLAAIHILINPEKSIWHTQWCKSLDYPNNISQSYLFWGRRDTSFWKKLLGGSFRRVTRLRWFDTWRRKGGKWKKRKTFFIRFVGRLRMRVLNREDKQWRKLGKLFWNFYTFINIRHRGRSKSRSFERAKVWRRGKVGL